MSADAVVTVHGRRTVVPDGATVLDQVEYLPPLSGGRPVAP